MPPLMAPHYFSESAHLWTVESQGTTDGPAGVTGKKVNLVAWLCNIEYGFAVTNYLEDEMTMSQCVLNCNGGMIWMLSKLEAMPYV